MTVVSMLDIPFMSTGYPAHISHDPHSENGKNHVLITTKTLLFYVHVDDAEVASIIRCIQILNCKAIINPQTVEKDKLSYRGLADEVQLYHNPFGSIPWENNNSISVPK